MNELPKCESLTVEFKSDERELPDRELILAAVCLANMVLNLVKQKGQITRKDVIELCRFSPDQANYYLIEVKPVNLMGDRAYDSAKLDDELREDGIELIATHRSNRKKPKTQDGHRMRRYLRR